MRSNWTPEMKAALSAKKLAQLRPSSTTKVCPRCQEEKPLEEFRIQRRKGKERIVYCDPCHSEKYRPQLRAYHYISNYGITESERDEMILQRNGHCDLCHEIPEQRLVVDHDHVSGEMRGIICQACNKLLGFARDDVVTLTHAIEYLGWAV